MRIGIDFDGTIAKNKFSYLMKYDGQIAKLKDAYYFLDPRRFLEKIIINEPFAGSREVINKLVEENNKIIIITNRKIKGLSFVKNFLEKYEIPYSKIFSAYTRSKAEIVKKLNIEVLIDDIYGNLKPLVGSKVKLFLFCPKKYKSCLEKLEKDIIPVASWPQFYYKLKSTLHKDI